MKINYIDSLDVTELGGYHSVVTPDKGVVATFTKYTEAEDFINETDKFGVFGYEIYYWYTKGWYV